MNDESNTALETLDRWWADAPTGQPSLPQIAETRTRIRRRRRRNYLAAGALAVVVAGSLAFGTSLGPDVDRREKLAKDPVDPPATQAVEALTAAPGYRLEAFQVGKFAVAIEVPEAWRSTWRTCEPRKGQTPPQVQHLPPGYRYEGGCPGPRDFGIKIQAGQAAIIRSPDTVRALGGVTLEARPGGCRASRPPFCGATASVSVDGVFTDGLSQAVTLTAYLHVENPDAIFNRIWASARIVPTGYVAIPPPTHDQPLDQANAYGEALRAAGLEPEEIQVDCGPAALCVGTAVVDVSPAPGSIVAKGSTVTVSHYRP